MLTALALITLAFGSLEPSEPPPGVLDLIAEAREPMTVEQEHAALLAFAQELEEEREQRLVALQEGLLDLGWYEGGVDGIQGSLTDQAIEDFAEAAGVSHEPEVVLASLDGGPAKPEPEPERDPKPEPEAPETSPSSATPSSGSGTVAEPWQSLADCESGNWQNGGASFERGSARWDWAKPGTEVPSWGTTVHHGGLQHHPGTWSAYRPGDYPEYAYDATPQQQIAVAEKVQASEGWGAWPTCSQKVGLR